MKRQTNSRSFVSKALQRCQPAAFTFFATVLSLPANAGITLPTDPLQSSGRIAPNILFILDDSGSMQYDYMPDNVPDTTTVRIETQAYTRNAVYYNPTINYRPWVDSTGTLMTGGTSYGSAFSNDAYLTGSTDLSGDTQTFYVPIDTTNTNAAYLADGKNYYRYQIRTDGKIAQSQWLARSGSAPGYNNGAPGLGCSNTSNVSTWRACQEATPTGRSVADEKTNFATWYSYYRTRMKAAKAGAGFAFSEVGKDVRVGFRTIWRRNLPSGTSLMTNDSPILVNRNDGLFDDPDGVAGANNNRTLWYQRLYGAAGSGATPLHSALTDAGKYYSSNSNNGAYGPQSGAAQFQCRQNFTILTTDGYWNGKDNYATADKANEQDNTPGPSTITSPTGDSYTYAPARPYSSGDSDTLADVAMKYWKTDLRTDLANIVPTTTANPAFWQHMVTFAISIGEKGTLNPDTDLPGLTAGSILWPTPVNNTIVNIDDLWHAAVNGRGKFLVASNPDEFAKGLKDALAAIVERTGSFANLAANSTQLGTGTQVFQASYVSGIWTGQLKSFPVTSTGVSDTASWSASAGIPTSGRKIFTINGTTGAVFPTTAQTTALARTDAPAVTGANNAAYLAGARNLELANGGTLRNRNHLLGDIVDSSPAYDSQTSVVYAGANDGMLHAFDAADNGKELFAYVPAGLNFADLATLSKPDYAHRYFVDGPLVLSTRAQTPAQSILVGTLGRGGKGIYALDVTTPGSFAAANVKWERTSTPLDNMGLVLGQPVITKLNNGDMGLIVPNGINSQNNHAALLVYNLDTGALLAEIDTGEGSAALPNGLSAPAARDADNNGTVDFVYAGDLRGNLWKFDLSDADPANWTDADNRLKMISAVNTAGQVQPITSAPTIARDPNTFKVWVFFGTGRFMTVDDLANQQIQSMYGILDGTTAITSRTTELQQRNIIVAGTVNGSGVRGFEAASALNTGARGWYIDLVDPPTPPGTVRGERIVSGMQVVANALITSSIIPSADPCLPGGTGYLNALDAFTGSSLSSSFFDLDADNNFDDEVIIIGTGSDQVVIPVGSIALGGLGTEGTLFGGGGGGGGGGLICLNISDASIECERIRELRNVGRVSWREVVRNDQ